MWTEMIFCYYLIKCGLQIDLLHLCEHSLCILTAWIMWLIPEWNETLNDTQFQLQSMMNMSFQEVATLFHLVLIPLLNW